MEQVEKHAPKTTLGSKGKGSTLWYFDQDLTSVLLQERLPLRDYEVCIQKKEARLDREDDWSVPSVRHFMMNSFQSYADAHIIREPTKWHLVLNVLEEIDVPRRDLAMLKSFILRCSFE